ncbi:MAG TPA: WecB/TagA/CpsF family glycosyltransferase [Candidatus Saccharimonadales bacterium]|nr:WecB/TagA/CpsF family glycosyltransferase [Candidatus Saccharimonadales bacterium]
MKNEQFKKTTDSRVEELVKTEILGVGITNANKKSVLEFVAKTLEEKNNKYFIVTPNPEIVMYASRHPKFKEILNNAGIALCDGMQLFRAAAFVGKPLIERITGVEFMESLCKYISKKPITVGFLGGKNGVAKMTAERLSKKYPGLKVCFIGEEHTDMINYELSITHKGKDNVRKNMHKNSKLEDNQRNNIDILFVAFGFPKQEEWMFKNLGRLNVSVMMGVGGAFDYISGKVQRAPIWIQSLGLEWLYRLIRQPWRWRRQLSLVTFVWLIMKEKIQKRIV